MKILKKKLILMIGAGILALLLLCVLIVGIVDGIWPWNGPKAYAKIFKPQAQEPAVTEPATEPTVETEPTESDEGGETDTTNRTPLLDGEKEDGSSDAKEEVDISGNTGDTTQVPDADATVSGSQIPGWGN